MINGKACLSKLGFFTSSTTTGAGSDGFSTGAADYFGAGGGHVI